MLIFFFFSLAYFHKHPERAFDSLDAIKIINDRRSVSEVLQSFCVSTLEGRVTQVRLSFVVGACASTLFRSRTLELLRIAKKGLRSRVECKWLIALVASVLNCSRPFSLPWVCKPLVADGIPESHNLGLIVRYLCFVVTIVSHFCERFARTDWLKRAFPISFSRFSITTA